MNADGSHATAQPRRTAVLFGSFDEHRHPRVTVLREGLIDAGWDLTVVNEPLGASTADKVAAARSPLAAMRFIGRVLRSWVRLLVPGAPHPRTRRGGRRLSGTPRRAPGPPALATIGAGGGPPGRAGRHGEGPRSGHRPHPAAAGSGGPCCVGSGRRRGGGHRRAAGAAAERRCVVGPWSCRWAPAHLVRALGTPAAAAAAGVLRRTLHAAARRPGDRPSAGHPPRTRRTDRRVDGAEQDRTCRRPGLRQVRPRQTSIGSTGSTRPTFPRSSPRTTSAWASSARPRRRCGWCRRRCTRAWPPARRSSPPTRLRSVVRSVTQRSSCRRATPLRWPTC